MASCGNGLDCDEACYGKTNNFIKDKNNLLSPPCIGTYVGEWIEEDEEKNYINNYFDSMIGTFRALHQPFFCLKSEFYPRDKAFQFASMSDPTENMGAHQCSVAPHILVSIVNSRWLLSKK